MKKNLKKKKKVKSLVSNVIFWVIFLVTITIILLSKYISKSFNDYSFDQLLYSLFYSEGTETTMVTGGIKFILPKFIFIIVIYIFIKIILRKILKKNICLDINFFRKKIRISILPLNKCIKIIIILIFFLLSMYYSSMNLGIIDYFSNSSVSSFIEENYIDAKKVNIKSPSEKNNLIYIYVESLESSMFSNANGGNFKESVIPNLEALALNNVSFSNNELLGGAYVPYGTTWTAAGIIATTSGVPLKLSIGNVHDANYSTKLSGVYALGDILERNGYKNYFFIGSEASFGGRADYLSEHGDYQFLDVDYLKDKGYVESDYNVWWGIEDSKLLDFAKTELTEIAKNAEPFNFTLLTSDTHATDGYLEDVCPNPYEEQYLNTYNCTDYLLTDFLDWLKEQDFYDNTTIIITGDHLSMQGNIFSLFDSENLYERKIYNTYINSKATSSNTKNRKFTSFDLYPTTLAALGFKIDGNKLGMGVNLFSDEETIIEKISFEEVEAELQKRSEFYNKNILK